MIFRCSGFRFRSCQAHESIGSSAIEYELERKGSTLTKSTLSHVSLFRLGVEGVVIVISILLAFGIDAWWEGRQEQQRAQNYGASLLEDARTNLERVEASRGQAENELRAVMKLGRLRATIKWSRRVISDCSRKTYDLQWQLGTRLGS